MAYTYNQQLKFASHGKVQLEFTVHESLYTFADVKTLWKCIFVKIM